MVRMYDPDALERELCLNSRDYELRESLGTGTFGTTSSARFRHGPGLFCIKAIPSFFIDRTRNKQAIGREILALSDLPHPGLVQMKGVIFPDRDAPNHFRFVVAPMERFSLREYLHTMHTTGSRTLSDTAKFRVLFGIASAMQFLHEKGYIHSFLTPSNIVIDSAEEPRVTDFWYPRFISIDRMPRPTSDLGIWSAPERWTSHTFTNKVDVYSFGMIMYEIVVGKPPTPSEPKFGDRLRPAYTDRQLSPRAAPVLLPI
jgi:serine/threonine protein kinase